MTTQWYTMHVVQDAHAYAVEPERNQPDHTLLLELVRSRTTQIEHQVGVELQSKGNRILALLEPETLRSLCRQLDEIESSGM